MSKSEKKNNAEIIVNETEPIFSEAYSGDLISLRASIVESSNDAIITKTTSGIITSWNKGAEKIYGYSAEEVIGEPISILIPQGQTDEVPEILERIRQGENSHPYETTRRCKDGRIVNVSICISPIKNNQGQIIGASTIAREITDEVNVRKLTEERLEAASQYARSLIEASLDPFVTINSDGKITDVNEAAVKITGIARETLTGMDFSDCFTEPEKARKGYQQVFAKGYVMDYPLTIRHKKGKLTDVIYNASTYKDKKGNILGVFAIARDVTELKQSFQYARSLIEASLDPFVTISGDGKITDVNEATAKITGIQREALIGTDFSDYFTEPDEARKGYEQVFARGYVTDYPLTIRNTKGWLTDVLYNASVYKDPDGNARGVFAAARDVTARKRAEKELAEQHQIELERLADLEKFQRLTVGRELKMIELKKEIEELKKDNESLKQRLGLNHDQ